MPRPTLVVMLKEPRPGRVKTRLGREIGMVGAAWWFRHQTRNLIRRLRDPRWTLVLAVSPDRAGLASCVWPADLPRIPQGHGNLGDRMTRILRGNRMPTLIVGADIPGIYKQHIARAFTALGAHDAVLGPAPDGGYWAIGISPTAPIPQGFLQNVRWSTEHAMRDTRRSLGTLSVAFVDSLQDVDTVADLRA